MRLLSVLVVAMIGVMIPSAFGIITYTEKLNHYGTCTSLASICIMK